MASCKGLYEVVRPIGSGSFGQVFLILHTVERRHYVMKEIASVATMDDEQRGSTELEVKLLSAISHPNIVGFRDSFMNDDGNLAIFMEYCEQGDMHTYLQEMKKIGKMPGEAKVLEWFVQITLALHALHVRNVLHRDLKTTNIFLTGSRVQHAFALKLGDFGIAKVLDSTQALAMTQIGTPFYMSPELFNNKPYGYKSDIWGLGIFLYEVVNGQRPFEAQSINGLAMKVLQGRYTPITASCTEETKFLIKSLLSNNPAHRPTLQELLHTPSIRRSIKPALECVTAAGTPEAQHEVILTQQLASLGLGGLVNCPEGAEPRRDRRQLQQRLERAERRRKREEETLRRLQETAALLAQSLRDTSQIPDLDLTDDAGPSFYSAAERCASNSARGEAFAEASAHSPRFGLHVDDCPPAMSHRDRVLQRKERRREEEQQKFEEEARKIREENIAYQRAWMQDSHRSRVPTKEPFQPASIASNSQAQHVLPHLPLGSNSSHCSPLAPLSGPAYEHIKAQNLANPFQSCHPNVVHTPRRQRFASEPKAPRPQFGHYQEPPPPHEAPHPTSGRWSHWSRNDTGQPFQTSRSVHSVCLDALSSDGFEKVPEHSEDSGPEGSPDHSDDGLADVGRRSFASDEQVRRHSLVVQQRIDACRAAICRHKMTIETLQYTFAQEGQEVVDQIPACGASYGSELAPHLRDRSATDSFAHLDAGEARRRGGGTPAIVLDRIARLKRRCLEGLGDELFQATRHYLQTLLDAGEVAETVRRAMLDKLGLEKIGFYSLIDQIVYMECRWGHGDAAPPELA